MHAGLPTPHPTRQLTSSLMTLKLKRGTCQRTRSTWQSLDTSVWSCASDLSLPGEGAKVPLMGMDTEL